MLASPLCNHLEYQLRRGNVLPWYRREEQVQSVLMLITRKEKAWRQFLFRNREHLGNLLHHFHQEAMNQETNLRVDDPSNLGRSLLEGSKDHLLSQARSELMRQEHQVGSLNSCINELQQQAYAQRLELQDAHHGFIESRREHSRQQEEERLLRGTHVRNIHELGDVKRAQELRVDEVSVQKLRESHDTIQRLTSQLQDLQEQMNSMNDSGESQEVESNHSGRLSHVPIQPAVIP